MPWLTPQGIRRMNQASFLDKESASADPCYICRIQPRADARGRIRHSSKAKLFVRGDQRWSISRDLYRI